MKKITVILRFVLIAAVLVSIFGLAGLPAGADIKANEVDGWTFTSSGGTASIEQIRFPPPGATILNDGTYTADFWWKITGASSVPVKMKHFIKGPGYGGPVIAGHTEEWDLTGETLPVYNPENYGADEAAKQALHGNESAVPSSAHSWSVPAGTAPGVYYSIVEYYSAGIPNGRDSLSEVAFVIEQPWQVYKYHDLDGNGSQDAGEPGLDDWSFSVTGPNGYSFSGTTSGGGYLVLPNAAKSGAYTITETLQTDWINTDPGGSSPYKKIVNIPEDLDPANPTVKFGNMYFLVVPPVPEVPAGLLLGLGVCGIAGVMVVKKIKTSAQAR